MADYSSPVRRKSTYSSPSSRSFLNHPPPDGTIRDTTINVATAFSNAEQQSHQYRTRSPHFQSSLSNHTSHLGNNYILSPSQRLSNLKRNSETYATLVGSDNDFFGNGQVKPLDFCANQPSSLSQSSSSDDEMDDNPFEEEELLALNPSEEEHRRDLIQQRSCTSERLFSNYGGSVTGSSFHSFGDNNNNNSCSMNTLNRMDDDNDNNYNYNNNRNRNRNKNKNNYNDSQQHSTLASSSSLPSNRPRIQLALERTFEIVMFWIFMVFWVIKEVAVAIFTFTFIIVSSLVINPIVFLLRLIGFQSLEPLELPQLKSSFSRGGVDGGVGIGGSHDHPSRLLATYSTKRKLVVLVVVAFGCYYLTCTGLFSGPMVVEMPHYLQQNQHHAVLERLYNTFSSSSSSAFWPSSTQSSMTTTGRHDNMKSSPSTTHYDSAMKERFTTLEKTVHGLIQHVEKQDENSQQQINAINYHLEQLQQQLTQWTSSQSTQMESSLMEQMDKVEKVLAVKTTEWTDQLHQWEQKYSHHEEQDGSISPKLLEALGRLFVSKSDANNNDDTSDSWETILQHNKVELDQHIQDMMDQWLQEQRRQGAWVDMDTLNETLMAQLVHAYNNNNNNNSDGDDDSNSMITPETGVMVRALIDTAIQKYHQDVLGTPDYALATRGAMVLAPFTSPTFIPHAHSEHQHWWWTRWYSQWSQSKVSPMVALTPGTHAGQCWPMNGDHGSLGIRLSEPIAVQAVTMEYPSRAMVANHVSSAPKEFEIWGITSIDDVMMANKNNHWANDTHMIFLGSFTYDIKSSAASLQTFSLDTNRYIVLQGVVVRVRSNWGHSHYTCLYRVRVHGTPAV